MSDNPLLTSDDRARIRELRLRISQAVQDNPPELVTVAIANTLGLALARQPFFRRAVLLQWVLNTLPMYVEAYRTGELEDI